MIVEIKYLPPTNTLNARIKVISNTENKIYPWNFSLDTRENHIQAALRFQKELGGKIPAFYYYHLLKDRIFVTFV